MLKEFREFAEETWEEAHGNGVGGRSSVEDVFGCEYRERDTLAENIIVGNYTSCEDGINCSTRWYRAMKVEGMLTVLGAWYQNEFRRE